MADTEKLNAEIANLNHRRPFKERPKDAEPVDGGGDGPHDSGMEQRVTRLETHMEYVRRDLDEIKGDLKTAVGQLKELPTKRDLDTWRWQWVATGAAIIAIVLGGMGWLAAISHP